MTAQNRPKGLLVSEYTALAAIYETAASRGLRLGRDLELVSRVHEANSLASLTPRPASIATSESLIAELAVQRLVHRMEHPENPAGLRILIPPKLIAAS